MSNGPWDIPMKKLGGPRLGCTNIKLLPKYLNQSFPSFYYSLFCTQWFSRGDICNSFVKIPLEAFLGHATSLIGLTLPILIRIVKNNNLCIACFSLFCVNIWLIKTQDVRKYLWQLTSRLWEKYLFVISQILSNFLLLMMILPCVYQKF